MDLHLALGLGITAQLLKERDCPPHGTVGHSRPFLHTVLFFALLLYLLAFLFPQSRKCRFESPLGWGVEVGLASFWTMSLALGHRNGFSD